MTGSLHTLLAGAVLLASAVPMFAGGLYITVGNPAAHPKAREMGAVLTLKLAGCHEPEKAEVTAAAVGTRDGKRLSIPLKITNLAEAGTYAVMPEWPKDGRWVLQFVARDGDRVTSTLVPAGPDGVERNAAKMAMKMPAESDIAALLGGTPKPDLARR